MTWNQGVSVVERRRQMVELFEAGVAAEQLAAHFEVCLSTIYRVVSAAKTEGIESAIVDKSRAPKRSPAAFPPFVIERILSLACQFEEGPEKLAALYREGFGQTVSKTAVAKFLKRYEVREQVRARVARHRHESMSMTEATTSNHVWAVDHKGHMGRQRIEPLTVIDEYSRFWLCCRPLTDKTYRDTRIAFEALFQQHGLPRIIRVDSGNPWVSVLSATRLTQLSAWWMALGIEIEIAPSPQHNGVVERLHGTMEREMSIKGVDDLRAHFERKQQHYNFTRPHHSLDMLCPADVYEPSPRPMKERVPNYSECDEVRSVGTAGDINWRGRRVFISEALVARRIGLRQLEPTRWQAKYYDIDIGILVDGATSLKRR